MTDELLTGRHPELVAFSNKVTHLSSRIEELQHQILLIKNAADRQLMEHAVDELLFSLEELQVADEELRQQNEALMLAYTRMEEEQQRYRELFEFAPIAYLITDTNGAIQEANLAALSLLNLKPDFFLFKPLSVFITHEERLKFRLNLAKLTAEQQVLSWETLLTPRRSPPVAVMLMGLRADNCYRRNTPCVRWLIYDLTERKKIEAAQLEQIFQTTFEHAGVGIARITLQGEWLHANRKLCEFLGYSFEELTGQPLFKLIHHDEVEDFITVFQQLMTGKVEQFSIENRYFHRNGSIRWGHLTASLVKSVGGRPLYLILVLENITRRKEMEMTELQQRLLAESLAHTAVSITGSLNLDEVLDQILTDLIEIIPHHAAAILLNEKQTLKIARNQGFRADFDCQDQSFSVEILRRAVVAKQPLIVEREVLQRCPMLVDEFQSGLVAPMILREQVIGFLVTFSHLPDFFTGLHAKYLHIFTTQAAVAIKNARVHEQEKVLVIQAERQHLARELHDAVTQSLFASKLIADSLPQTLRENPEKLEESLEELKLLNESAAAEMRMLLLELRPTQLLKARLSDNLRHLATAMKGRKRIQLRLDIRENYPIPPEIQFALYRIAQEAMNNIIKHASARRVEVMLKSTPTRVILKIKDDGVGFDPVQVTSGLGLDNMRERAREIEAAFSLVSKPGKGTTVEVQKPLNAALRRGVQA